jgi:hypothetical protein
VVRPEDVPPCKSVDLHPHAALVIAITESLNVRYGALKTIPVLPSPSQVEVTPRFDNNCTLKVWSQGESGVLSRLWAFEGNQSAFRGMTKY